MTGDAAGEVSTAREVSTAVRELLDPIDIYAADGTWSEAAQRAACERLSAGGWLGAGLSVRLGGAGGDLRDAVAVTGACAAAGHRLPAADAGIVAAHVLELSGLPAPPGLLVPVPAACTLRDGRLLVRAERVPFARWAATLLVVADDGDSGTGLRTCLIDAAAAQIVAGANLAGEPRDTVLIDGARPAAVAAADGGIRDQLHRAGALARASQIAAATERMLDLATGYCRQRRQFGRELAQFQAVQQQLALLAAEALAARAAVQRALALLGPGLWPLEPVAVAKVRTGLAATAASRIAHQLHGAIGITAEHALHRFTVPAWSWREEYGTERHWSAALIADRGPHLWPSLTTGP
ncbi:MAG TPA: acyl-CoA dehydrogenase family protein [Streptosporangiaceae bacterium]